MIMKRFIVILMGALLITSLTVPVSASEGTSNPETEEITEETETGMYRDAAKENHLVVANTTPFGGTFFTQMFGNNGSDLDVRLLIHGCNLVELNNETDVYDINNSIVKDYSVTVDEEGNHIYTLNLYDDIYFSDGTPITAWDYAFSKLLMLSPEITEIGGAVRHMEYLVGYENYVTGKTKHLSGIHVNNDTQFSYTIAHEYLPFFFELALLDTMPYPISVIAPGCEVKSDENGVYIEGDFTAKLLEETILDPETGYLSHPMVSAGPYHLLSYEGEVVELEANPYYKGNTDGVKPAIEYITYVTEHTDDIISQLKTGEIDLINKSVSLKVIEEGRELIAQDGRFSVSDYARDGLAYLAFCCERPAMSYLAVRKAIAHCIDKKETVSRMLGHYGVPVDGYYGIGTWMYQAVNGIMDNPYERSDEAGGAEMMQKSSAWEELSLDNMPVYELDIDKAVSILEKGGWTLNRDGKEFDPEKDDVRCKYVDGELTALDLELLYPDENIHLEVLNDTLGANMAKAGMKLTITPVPMAELLDIFYRYVPRTCDMIFMATNFDLVFDPGMTFRPDGANINHYNFMAIQDESLYLLGTDLRHTAPSDYLGYLQKWIRFQERLQEEVPGIGLYSNIYFDFHTGELKNYHIDSHLSWSNAVLKAHLGSYDEESDEEINELYIIDEFLGSGPTD